MLKIAAFFWSIIKAIMNWCRSVFTKITKVEINDEVWEGLIQFVKFGLVGFSNTIISYATYYILVPFFHCNKYVASVIGFILSVVNAFYWNNSYVFKKDEEEKRSPILAFIKLFLSYAGTGLLLHNVLLWLFVDIIGINQYVAPIINLFITIPTNFLLNKFWAFRKEKRESGQTDDKDFAQEEK